MPVIGMFEGRAETALFRVLYAGRRVMFRSQSQQNPPEYGHAVVMLRSLGDSPRFAPGHFCYTIQSTAYRTEECMFGELSVLLPCVL